LIARQKQSGFMQSLFDCVLLSIRNSKTGANILRGAARFLLAGHFLLCFDSVLIYLRVSGYRGRAIYKEKQTWIIK